LPAPKKAPQRGAFFDAAGLEPISMQHAGGVLRPPVQKLVASIAFRKAESAIESGCRPTPEEGAPQRGAFFDAAGLEPI